MLHRLMSTDSVLSVLIKFQSIDFQSLTGVHKAFMRVNVNTLNKKGPSKEPV